MLAEVIGKAAMLEQTAEECMELGKACLKYARYIRGENKVYNPLDDIIHGLHEEIADVLICIEELGSVDDISQSYIDTMVLYKKKRMVERMQESERDNAENG